MKFREVPFTAGDSSCRHLTTLQVDSLGPQSGRGRGVQDSVLPGDRGGPEGAGGHAGAGVSLQQPPRRGAVAPGPAQRGPAPEAGGAHPAGGHHPQADRHAVQVRIVCTIDRDSNEPSRIFAKQTAFQL